MAKDTKKILADVKRQYWDWQWPGVYTYWRFWEYPRYLAMEKMLPKKGTILDLGSGFGIFTNFLAASGLRRRIVAMEYDRKKVKIAKKGYKNVRYLACDVTSAKVPKADAIVLMHVLHHLDSYKAQEKLLTEVCQKLKRGGTLLIDEVVNQPPWKRRFGRIVDWLLYPFQPIYYRYQPEMENLLAQFPLEVIKIANVDGFFSPFAQIVYLCRKT